MLKPFLLSLTLLLPATLTAEPARNFAELVHASGVDVSYGSLGEVMGDGASAVGLNIDQASAWRRAAQVAFDGGLVVDQIVRSVEANHDFADFAEAALFFDSALGRRVTQAENAAQKITDEAQIDSEGAAIMNRLLAEDPDRMALYRRMVEDSGLLESTLAATMSMNLAMVNGMQASGLMPFAMSQAEIMEMLSAQSGAMTAELEQAIYLQTAFTYAEISDDDMAAYADFLTGDTGRGFYAALQAAVSEVLNARAHEFGEIFAQLLEESSL